MNILIGIIIGQWILGIIISLICIIIGFVQRDKKVLDDGLFLFVWCLCLGWLFTIPVLLMFAVDKRFDNK